MTRSSRFRQLQERRDEAHAELERALIDEWDVASQVGPPLVVPPAPPPRPPAVTVEEPPPPALSDSAKRVIAIVATTLGLAIAAALKGL